MRSSVTWDRATSLNRDRLGIAARFQPCGIDSTTPRPKSSSELLPRQKAVARRPSHGLRACSNLDLVIGCDRHGMRRKQISTFKILRD